MEQFEELLRDPISYEIMEDAVITPYGHSYSEKSICEWLDKNESDPQTKKPLKKTDLRPNFALRDIIAHYRAEFQTATGIHVPGKEFSNNVRTSGVNIVLFEVPDGTDSTSFPQLADDKHRILESVAQVAFMQTDLAQKELQLKRAASEKTRIADECVNLEHEIIVENEKYMALEMQFRELSLAKQQLEPSLEKLSKQNSDYKKVLQAQLKLASTNPEIQKKMAQLQQLVSKNDEQLLVMQNQYTELTTRSTGLKAQMASFKQDIVVPKEQRLLQLSDRAKRVAQSETHTIVQIQNMQSEIQAAETNVKEGIAKMVTYKSHFDNFHKEVTREQATIEAMAPKIQKATELKEEGNSLLTEKKEYEAALQKYSEAIDLISPYVYETFFLNRAYVYQLVQNHQRCIEDCEIVMVKNPNNKRALQRAAASYFSLKEYQKAMECYNKLIDLDPKDANAQDMLKHIYQCLQQRNWENVYSKGASRG